MMNSNAVIRECAVDWITATSKMPEHTIDLIAMGKRVVAGLTAKGDIERTFDWRGYQLHRAGPVAWGERYDGAMLQISGDLAQAYFLAAYQNSDHVARIDLQVTAQVEQDTDDLASTAYLRALFPDGNASAKIGYSHVQNSTGGSTLYVGARSSEQLGRLYNKWAESRLDQYRGCWRYEVELKNDLATDMAHALSTASHPLSLIAGFVHRWYSMRGITPAFTSESPFDLRPLSKRPTDMERKLEWLGGQVRPTVAELKKRGYLARALRALGLEDEAYSHMDATEFGGNGNHEKDLGGVE